MQFTSESTRKLETDIKDVEQKLSVLNDQLKLLKDEYMRSVWNDEAGLLKKCFRCDKCFPDGTRISTYAVINRLPISRNFRTGDTFQPHNLPSIQFEFSETRFVPYCDSEESGDEDVIYFNTIFIEDLPAPWGHPVGKNKWPLWTEITQEEFLNALQGRILSVVAKIFE